MPSMRPSVLLLWTLSPLALSSATSCSVATKFQDPCATNTECRDAFGIGWVCGDGGLCEEVAADPLCPNTAFFPKRPDDKDTVLIASLLDSVGDVDMVDAAVLAIQQALEEAAPPIPRSFALIRCTYGGDENSQIANARKAARYAVDDLGAVAIIGPGTSKLAEVVYQEVGDRALIISPSATSDSLSIIDGTEKSAAEPGLFWRTVASDNYQGTVIAELLDDAARGHVAIVHKTGSYGEGLALRITTSLEERGFTGERIVLYPYSSILSLSESIPKIDVSPAEEVVFIADSNDEVVSFLNVASGKAGFASKAILLGDAGYADAVLAAVAASSFNEEQIRGVRPSPAEGAVYNAYKSAYGFVHGREPTAYTAETFDATWLAIYGVTWSMLQEGALSPIGMAKGLHQISSGQEFKIVQSTWRQIGQLFSEGKSVDVSGASGELNFDPVTEETDGRIEVWTIKGGAFARVEVK